jgi:small subunit ribosomal protein S4
LSIVKLARYIGPKEKIERRIGERLFLKGERSHSQKSAMVKKPYPPGIHGRAKSKKPSEFSMQLRSKQKVRNIYRLMENQFKNYIKASLTSKDKPYDEILNRLEYRLDNVVFRCGLAQSRDQARQLVSHGHILVNKKRVNIPSYNTQIGDEISVREGSKKTKYFSSHVDTWLKSYESPNWIELNKTDPSAKIKGQPMLKESGIEIDDLQSIIEFYSR